MAVPLSSGLVVAERYRLVRRLGEGGMGVVWAAEHVVTGRGVALKLLKSRDLTSVRRFMREAKIAGTLAHAGIIAVHDVLQLPDGTPAMVMDLLEGESLAERLVATGRLPPDEVARMLVPVVDAVAAAHARGVVHRDLKPANIHLSARGERIHVTVLDFGIAKVLEPESGRAVTETGAILGTPHYMAPEQVFGDRTVDGAADVWALGVIGYEALSGARPFDGDNYGQVFKAITLGQPRKLPADVPKRLASLVMRMLDRDRDARPTLSEIRAVLVSIGAPALDSRGTIPPVSSVPSPKGATPSRRWTAIPLTLVAAALVFAWLRRPAPAPLVASASRPPVANAAPIATPEATVAEIVPTKTATSASIAAVPAPKRVTKPVIAAAKPDVPPAPQPIASTAKLPGGVHGVSPY